MHLPLPRRHRRKLLLPPGLLALAGLLWLGSVAIGSWREKLQQKTVVQLTMPSLRPQDDYPTTPPNPLKWSVARLAQFRQWRTVTLNGCSDTGAVTDHQLEAAVAELEAHSSSDDGVRVSFGPTATYANLVRVLDLMAQYNIKKYWLDVWHGPVTFYAITMRPVVRKNQSGSSLPLGPCIVYSKFSPSSGPQYHSDSYLLRLNSWLLAVWNPELRNTSWYTSAVGTGTEYDITLRLEKQYFVSYLRSIPHRIFLLSRSEWRIQFLLVIGMTAISWWKLKRQFQLS